MPIYEYQCLICYYKFEDFIFPGRIQEPNNRCPKCGAIKTKMIPSMIGLAMHNTEMITPRDSYKVRHKAKKEGKDGRQIKEKS